MKVIFLDIDGVLNCSGSKSSMVLENGETYLGIDKHKILRLKEIVDRSGAKIVLISTWRLHLYKNDRVDKYMRQRFKKYGIEIYSCVDYIEHNRGSGIHLWLLKHPDVTDWVVLDDEWFLDYNEKISQHLILTNGEITEGGLRDEHISVACDILNGKLQDQQLKDLDHPDQWIHVGLDQ